MKTRKNHSGGWPPSRKAMTRKPSDHRQAARNASFDSVRMPKRVTSVALVIEAQPMPAASTPK